jgi:hypothetical protein
MLKLPPTHCAKANMGAQEATAVSSTVSVKALADKIRNVGDDILDIMEKAGGHTLKKHVGNSTNKITTRASRDKIKRASCFTNKRTAINAVKENLRNNADKIAKWLQSSLADDQKAFDWGHAYGVGEGILQGKKNITYGLKTSKIVLEPDATLELGFKIITAFPVCR